MASTKISVSRIQPGLHIRLPVKWNDHPFLFNTFKIKSNEQVRVIKQLGVKYVYITPELSDVLPLPIEATPAVTSNTINQEDNADAERLWAEKQERIEKLSLYRRRVSRCEKEFDRSLALIRNIMAKLRSRPELAIQESELLIEDIVDSLLGEDDVTLHLNGG